MKSGLIYIIGILALTTGLFPYMRYENNKVDINGRPVVSHALEVDFHDPRVSIDHGFSFGMLYGFQQTSEIADDQEAFAAVNGMFYDDLGMPIGVIIDDGRPVRIHDAGTPVVMISDSGDAVIDEVDSEAMMMVGDGYVWLYSVNGRVPDGSWGYFEPVFGRTTRIQRLTTNYLISDGFITNIVRSESPVSLRESEGVLVYAGNDDSFSVGDKVELTFDLGMDFPVETAFQAGGWLVKGGKNVAAPFDAFIGHTTAPQPRTMVGVTEKGSLLFVVVDGRRQGYSVGVTGYEGAEMMIGFGCTEAAYLDGGASSTLWYDGQMVNRPSGSEERAVAHVLLIKNAAQKD